MKRTFSRTHHGLSVRAHFLFPEFYTPSTNKFILDWKTFELKQEPLPLAHKPNIPVAHNWTENIMHNTNTAKNELAKVYEPFSLPELDVVINKIKIKAPGHDNLTIDCFKHLGPGGKHKLLDI